MRKGAYLEITLHDPSGSPTGAIQTQMQNQLAGDHNGLRIHVLQAYADSTDPLNRHLVLYVQGDQPAADDFEQLATSTVQGLLGGIPAQLPAAGVGTPPPTTVAPQLLRVEKWEGYDTVSAPWATAGVAPAALPPATQALAQGCFAPVSGGQPTAGTALPADTLRQAPQTGIFDGCPAGGDGNSQQQDVLKNRTDTGTWTLATAGAILALPVPPNLPTSRSAWSAADQATIGHYEGLPLQVEGYLAGARIEGPESCNCHAEADLDYHLWLVDTSGTGRDESVVAEATPRVRATHPGWTIDRICALVNNQSRVRISGWLMMDPAHSDQVGTTRGTTWEIHPILEIEIAQASGWVALDSLP